MLSEQYKYLQRARAWAFASYTLLSTTMEKEKPQAEKSVVIINQELIIETLSLAIQEMPLTKEEKFQENIEMQVVRGIGLCKDERFKIEQ